MKPPAPVSPAISATRLLGLHIQEGRDGDYGRAFAQAKAIGVGAVPLSFDWSRIETAPGQFTSRLPVIANQFYPAQKMPIFLILRPINTVRREVPADLAGVPWDDPRMRTRFRAFLDYILNTMRDVSLVGLAIGNELSTVLSQERNGWRTYGTFLAEMRDYVHSKRPGVTVGVPVAFTDLIDAKFEQQTRELNRNTDAVFVTYYPLLPDFTVRPPESPRTDFARLVRAYPNRAIYFVEAGYPSSTNCNSSETMQSGFIDSVFAAWDQHSSQIPLVAFSWQTDHSPADIEALTKYYSVPGTGFRGFLASLGLRHGDGRPKPAWESLIRAAKSRRWTPAV